MFIKPTKKWKKKYYIKCHLRTKTLRVNFNWICIVYLLQYTYEKKKNELEMYRIIIYKYFYTKSNKMIFTLFCLNRATNICNVFVSFQFKGNGFCVFFFLIIFLFYLVLLFSFFSIRIFSIFFSFTKKNEISLIYCQMIFVLRINEILKW